MVGLVLATTTLILVIYKQTLISIIMHICYMRERRDWGKHCWLQYGSLHYFVLLFLFWFVCVCLLSAVVFTVSIWLWLVIIIQIIVIYSFIIVIFQLCCYVVLVDFIWIFCVLISLTFLFNFSSCLFKSISVLWFLILFSFIYLSLHFLFISSISLIWRLNS